MTFDPESVDLMTLTEEVRRRAHGAKDLDGYLEGKTVVRAIVVTELGCSELEAEQVVDTMIARGFIRFRRGLATRAETAELAEGFWELRERN